jgi:hypothetical protein
MLAKVSPTSSLSKDGADLIRKRAPVYTPSRYRPPPAPPSSSYLNMISEPGVHSSVVAPPSMFCAGPNESVIT